jgi:hypothetical protein
MKLDVEVQNELKKIRNAIDDMYDKLNTNLYEKHTAAKVTYSEVNPFNSVSDNFEFISTIIRNLQDAEIIGEE